MIGRIVYIVDHIIYLSEKATEWEVKVQYTSLARKYHPVKHDPHVTGLTSGEAGEFFKLINNAHELLRNTM